jgi:hypothetical protein
MEWESRFAKIVYERGHEQFFERFLLASQVQQLIIVSPWITALRAESITLEDIIAKISYDRVRTVVIMRPPHKDSINLEAVQLLSRNQFVTIYFNAELHAKVYVCRCHPFGFALIGSANLSGQATRALEIGVLIEGRGYGMNIVEELERLGTEDLPNRSGTLLYAQSRPKEEPTLGRR